jgi:hypothetical protein
MSFARGLAWGVLALFCSAALAWADPVAQVVKLNGAAAVTRGNASAPLLLGAALENGDVITTSAGGRVRLQLIDGSVINIGSDAELALDEVVSGGVGTERNIILDLLLGTVRTHAAPATPNSRFEITTPKAISAVRGTEWFVRSAAVASDVLVLTGRVGVRKNEVSGKSAISLTRTLGVTITDNGLGQITRWTEEQVAALIAATDVPGPERSFDLGSAPALDLGPAVTPAPTEDTPDKDMPGGTTPRTKRKCYLPFDDRCERPSNDRDQQDHDSSSDKGNDSGNDNDSGSSF